ncbi:unnamed protein product (mitochondrion) [Plasmodiophora brassicae]|uniref:Uncharacterized protein n=1 Tax=Plasmodiophora brassicae TaxID=37360 RepID=A0A0G4J8P8_PLABS|nr:hypothetical protein PBRA_009496 [Plasmodiophora brassicae]SPQ94398.1 unnamed protein product [Plasmodiophora brassicae]
MDHDPLEDDSMDAGGTDLTDRLTGPKRPRSTGEPPLTPARYTASFKKKRKMTKAKTDVATLDRIWSTAPASSNDDDYHDAATITPPAPTSAKGLITMLHQRLPGLQHFNLTSNINKGKLPNEYVLLGLKIGQYRTISRAAQEIGAGCRPGPSHHRQIIIYNCTVHDIDDIMSIGYPGQPIPYKITPTSTGPHAIASFATKEEALAVAKAKRIRAGQMQWHIKQSRANNNMIYRTCKSIECRDPACENLRCGYECTTQHATNKRLLTEEQKQSKGATC